VTFIGGAVIFVGGAMTFIGRATTFIGGVVIFIGGAVMFISGAVTFIGRAATFIEGTITFVDKGSSAIGGRSFKTARARVVNDIKVNRRNLRRRLIIYKLKGPSVSINSLISASNYSI
jgi:hypothetical protein